MPWMHRKIAREQYEPYSKWKTDQNDQGRHGDKSPEHPEKPYFNDTITAAGKEWTRENSVSDLRDLHTYLWDNHDERIPLPEYKKLVGWIKEKEQLRTADRSDASNRQPKKEPDKEKQYFEYRNERYGRNSSYQKLTDLASRLREKHAQRLPIDDYHKLRAWIENADRARWAGVIERQLELSKVRFARDEAKKAAPNAHRYVNPLQEQMMANPVVGLFMQGASIANQLVRWVDLRDTRDPLKETRDALEDAKTERHQDYVSPDRTHEQKVSDKQAIDNIDRAIDENEEIRKKRRKEKEKRRDKRDRGLDFMR